jgi:hypothetical protein
MRGFRYFKAFKMPFFVAVAFTVLSFVTMHLWNWVMPAIFGLKTITWLQALGLLLLCKILGGGFYRHGGGCRGGRREWKQRMTEKWMEMTPEERERFRAGMGGRWGCGFDPEGGPKPEQKPAV